MATATSASSDNTATRFGYPLYPAFRPGEARFPQDTFLGRYAHYLDVVDPRTLLTSENKLQASIDLLERYKRGDAVTASNRDLWEAQKIKQAIIHPDTGKKVFMPFRMSGYVPFGWITVTGMLLPNPSWPTLMFWQWMNQSHNACVNYANRNATKPQPASKFVSAYAGAVSAALTISMSLTYLIKKADRLPAAQKLVIQRFVPLPATALASSCNVILMRHGEINTGIEVYDCENNVVGTSQVAAYRAVRDTTLTRAFLPVPLLLAPPCIMPFLEKTRFLKRNPRWHLLVNAIVCTISFGISLPVALALFPQESTINTSDLEPELQSRTNQRQLYYNRGL
uniref:Sidoreflexin n=1 Tax=Plectus sambesii TaxID=2011161 RepID=A0A914WPX0_9BILA